MNSFCVRVYHTTSQLRDFESSAGPRTRRPRPHPPGPWRSSYHASPHPAVATALVA